MCIARQRAATGAGEANWLRSAPVTPTKTMSRAAREPRPISPPLPSTPRLNGISAAIRTVCSRVSLMVMWIRRNAIEATAVTRWMPCATIRWRVLRMSRSCATSPQITDEVRLTRDSTPAPKSRNRWSQLPPSRTTTGMSSRTTAVATP